MTNENATATTSESPDKEKDGERPWESIATIGFMLCTLGEFTFAGAAGHGFGDRIQLGAYLFLIALAAWISGGLIGFLFGIPRFKAEQQGAEEQRTATYTPNTNLDQISDWLTKIFIGATLVQIKQIPPAFQSLCIWAAASSGSEAFAPAIGAVIVANSLIGFLWGYLWATVRVKRELSEA